MIDLPTLENHDTARRDRESGEVRGSLTVRVDASVAMVRAALAHVDLTGPINRALGALDADRLALAPVRLDERTYGLIWNVNGGSASVGAVEFGSFDWPGHVKVRWDADVRAGEEGAFVTLATRIGGTDAAAHARVLDAWGVLGPLIDTLARRFVRAIAAASGSAT